MQENFLQKAMAIKDEIIKNRRALHTIPEIGLELKQTHAYVLEQLQSYGYTPSTIGKSGIVCTVGKGSKTILLRGDMDALPMREESGLPFQADNGNAHTCGHDAHTAMLLGAAKLLKEYEHELKGCVKLMFQPGEEPLLGAAAMIAEGVLEHPKVDAALAIHVMVGTEHSDSGVIYCGEGTVASSSDSIAITITGRAAHGSTPYLGIDANNIAAHIILGLNNIVAKEISMYDQSVILVGKMQGGTVKNTVAETTVLEICTRSMTPEIRRYQNKRIVEMAEGIAMAFGGTAKVEFLTGVPPIINDQVLCNQVREYCSFLIGEAGVNHAGRLGGSEDFALITEQVPGVFMMLGAGSPKEGYHSTIHLPEMTINEDALPVGTAVYAECAVKWLENN